MLHQHSQNAGSGLTVPTVMEMGHPQTAHTTHGFASISTKLASGVLTLLQQCELTTLHTPVDAYASKTGSFRH